MVYQAQGRVSIGLRCLGGSARVSLSHMAALNLTDDAIKAKLYGLSSLHDASRAAILSAIEKLNGAGDWYPQSFRRELHAIEAAGTLTEFERHAVEQAFFPGSW